MSNISEERLPLNANRLNDLQNSSRINRLRRWRRSRQQRQQQNNTTENNVVMISSDSEEEERRINQEIGNLASEFSRIESSLSRTRQRLRRLYEKRENIRIRRAVRLREIELSRRFRNRWLPDLTEVQRNAFRIENNILNDINNNLQENDNDDDIELPTAEEVLNQLCGPNLNVSSLNDVD